MTYGYFDNDFVNKYLAWIYECDLMVCNNK